MSDTVNMLCEIKQETVDYDSEVWELKYRMEGKMPAIMH